MLYNLHLDPMPKTRKLIYYHIGLIQSAKPFAIKGSIQNIIYNPSLHSMTIIVEFRAKKNKNNIQIVTITITIIIITSFHLLLYSSI